MEPTLGVWPIYDTHNNFFCNRVVFNMSQTIHVCIYSLLWAYGELLMQLQLYQNKCSTEVECKQRNEAAISTKFQQIHSQMPVCILCYCSMFVNKAYIHVWPCLQGKVILSYQVDRYAVYV